VPAELHAATLVIHGEHDDTVPLAAVLDWARPQSLPVTVVPGGGISFTDNCRCSSRWWRATCAPEPPHPLFPLPKPMMNRLLKTLAAFTLSSAALLAHAQAPQPPEVAAKAYLLMDVSSGQILAGKDMDAPVEPASLTKLMTAYVVFDALRAKKVSWRRPCR
jgi:hypothetical protein